MGWFYEHRPAGISNREFFARDSGSGQTIVACATVNTREFYAAVREADGSTWAYVALLDWRPNEHCNFGYKPMDEGMGPVANCPRKVLDALSPVEDLYPWDGTGREPYAYQWRRDCAANLAHADKARAVKRGDTITFAEPISFGDGSSGQTFTFVARSDLRRTSDGQLCQIRAWRKLEFTHTPQGALL